MIKELKIRGLIKRILLITPANLSFQWQREMREKFRENFEVIRGDVLRANYGVNPWQERDQLIEILQGITGEAPKGYRSPSWELSEHSLGFMSSLGFLYDTSLMGDDAPYLFEETASGKPMVELPMHWLLDDAPNFVYAPLANRLGPMRNPEEVFGTWATEFEGFYRYGRSFNLTMHPQYIGRPGRLLMLERLIDHIRSFPNVEFMLCQDVAEMWVNW